MLFTKRIARPGLQDYAIMGNDFLSEIHIVRVTNGV